MDLLMGVKQFFNNFCFNIFFNYIIFIYFFDKYKIYKKVKEYNLKITLYLYFKIIKNKVQLIYLIKSFHKKKKKSSYQYKILKRNCI